MSKIELTYQRMIAYKDIWFFIDEFFDVYKLRRTGLKNTPLEIIKVKEYANIEGQLHFDLENLYQEK